MDPEIADVWDDYRDRGDAHAREQLILHYAPLVKYVAGRVGVTLPDTIDQTDLISYGMFGLIDAIERFDRDKGVKFATYAVTRIRGAIIDELRRLDWVPRSVRAKAKTIAAAIRRLEAELHRSPTEAEVAGELGVTEAELATMLEETTQTSLGELDRTLSSQEGEYVTLVDTLQDTTMVHPQENLDDMETRRLLTESIRSLPEREQTILALYYYEGMTLAQIGDVIGVTESRVCQIHSKAVMTLRNHLVDAMAS
ncbi:MAG TPA: FliA/WhiG family RNA polymerase sigma factor [Nitriliruptorales bacterium]|nr:FliA/WhiG family RNA polymerase sigma factor [Nitriliruptorales bacterium]